MKKFLLPLAGVLFSAGMLYAQDCSELFFSEYLEGSGNNKGLEIYNPTENIVDLSQYYVARYSNGGQTYDAGGITRLQGFLQGYDVFLLVNGQTTSTETSPACDPDLQAMADQLDGAYPAPTYMNGNDAIALFKDTGGSGDINDFILVDLFGIVGGGVVSDDVGWTDFTNTWVYKNVYDGDGNITGKDSTYIENYIVSSGYYWLALSANHSLVRKKSVRHGVTTETMPTTAFNLAVEWDTVPGGQDVWDSLGAHYCNCQYVGKEEFEMSTTINVWPNPAGKGIVNINSADPVAFIEIFDMKGTMVLREEADGIENEKYLRLSDNMKGIYLIKVNTVTGGVATKKIVIQ